MSGLIVKKKTDDSKALKVRISSALSAELESLEAEAARQGFEFDISGVVEAFLVKQVAKAKKSLGESRGGDS